MHGGKMSRTKSRKAGVGLTLIWQHKSSATIPSLVSKNSNFKIKGWKREESDFYFFIYLIIYLFGVLRPPLYYFTPVTPASTMMRTNQIEPRVNLRQPAGCWRGRWWSTHELDLISQQPHRWKAQCSFHRADVLIPSATGAQWCRQKLSLMAYRIFH